jgi:WD40 repeat protein
MKMFHCRVGFIVGVLSLFIFESWLSAYSLDGTGSIIYQNSPHVFYDTDYARGFVRINNGFTVLPAATADLDVAMRVAGGIDLRDYGVLHVLHNVMFDQNVTFSAGGIIQSEGSVIGLGGNCVIPANSIIHFRGDTIWDGNGNILFLGDNAQLFVDSNATLTLRNMTIQNSKNQIGHPVIKCASPSSSLALQNVNLAFADDCYFDQGQLFIHGDVNITGTSQFVYRSPSKCFVDGHSVLFMDAGTTFDYSPSTTGRYDVSARDNVQFKDQTSHLYLNGSSLLTTNTGLSLDKGTLVVADAPMITDVAKNINNFSLGIVERAVGTAWGNSVAWNPSGEFLTIGKRYGSGKELTHYVFDGVNLSLKDTIDFTTSVTALAWSPDGLRLAVGGEDSLVYKLNDTGTISSTFQNIGSNVEVVGWSPRGDYLAVGRATGIELYFVNIEWWNIFSLGSIYTKLFANGVSALAWHPSTRYLAVGADDGSSEVFIYEFTGVGLAEITNELFGTRVNAIAWSPDGHYVAVGGDNDPNDVIIYSFDGSSLTQVTTLDCGDAVKTIVWDNRYISIGCADGMVALYTFDGSALALYTQKNIGSSVNSLAWHPDGNLLTAGIAPGSSGYDMLTFNVQGQSFVDQRDLYGAFNGGLGVSWHPSGKYVATCGANGTADVTVFYFNGASVTELVGCQQDFGTQANAVAWSPNGHHLAAVGIDGSTDVRIYSFDGTSLTVVDSEDFGSGAYAVAWSPDGRYVAVAGNNGTDDVVVYEFDGISLTQVDSVDYGTAAYAVAWSPDGYSIAVGGDHTSTVSVYWFDGSSLTTDTNVQKTSPATPVKSVAWSADGQTLVACGATGTTKTVVGYRYNGSSLMSAFSNNITVASGSDVRACISPDGRYVAAGGYDGSSNLVLKVYDVLGGTVISYSGVNRDLLMTNLAWDVSGNYVALIGSSSVTARGLVVCPVVYADNTTAQATLNGIVLGGYLSVNAIEGTRLAINGNFSGDLENVTGFASIVHQPQPGKLKLQKDLNLGVDLHPLFNSLKSVESNGKSIVLTDELVVNPNTVVHFADNALIDGRGNAITMGIDSRFLVDDHVTVTIKNTNISSDAHGPGNAPLACITDSGVLALDNVTVSPHGDFYFNRGSLYAHNKVNLDGDGTFVYRSIRPSYITSGAELTITPNVVFDFQPTMTYYPKRYPEPKDLFVMQDATSKMILDSSSLQATATGLRITKGSVVAQGKVTLNSYTPQLAEELGTNSTIVDLNSNFFVDWHPSGKYIAVGIYDNWGDPEVYPGLRVYEIDQNRFVRKWETSLDLSEDFSDANNVTSVSWSYDGRFLAVGGYGDGSGWWGDYHGLHIYEFDGNSLTLRNSYYLGYEDNNVECIVAWQPGSYTLSVLPHYDIWEKALRLYEFDPNTNEINPVYQEYSTSALVQQAWSPDGKYLVVGEYTSGLDVYEAAKVWRFDALSTTSLTLTYSTYYDDPGEWYDIIRSLAWSRAPSGNQFLSVSSLYDKFRTYEVSDALVTEIAEWRVQNDYPLAVALHPSGQYLFCGVDGGRGSVNPKLPQLYLYELASTPTELTSQYGWQKKYSLNSCRPYEAKWSLDGTRLATGSYGYYSTSGLVVYSFDEQTLDTPLSSLRQDCIYEAICVAWHPTGNFIAVGGGANGKGLRVFAFDGTSLATDINLSKDFFSMFTVDWSSDGRYLLVCGQASSWGGNTAVVIYEFDGLTLTQKVRFDTGLYYSGSTDLPAAAFSPDGKYVAAVYGVYAFDGASLNLKASTGGGYFRRKISWTSDGQYIASANPAGCIYRFDGSSLTLVPNSYTNSRAAWHPSNRYLAAVSTAGTRVYEFDAEKLVYNAGLHVSNRPRGLSWSPDGRYLATLGQDEGLNFYAVQIYAFDGVSLSSSPSLMLPVCQDDSENIAWSPDGNYIAVGCRDPYPGYEEFMVLSVNWTDTTCRPAAQHGITFGNSIKGSDYNANLNLLPNAKVDVHGPLVFDNV